MADVEAESSNGTKLSFEGAENKDVPAVPASVPEGPNEAMSKDVHDVMHSDVRVLRRMSGRRMLTLLVDWADYGA